MHTKYRLTLFIPSHHSVPVKLILNLQQMRNMYITHTHTHTVWKNHSKMGFQCVNRISCKLCIPLTTIISLNVNYAILYAVANAATRHFHVCVCHFLCVCLLCMQNRFCNSFVRFFNLINRHWSTLDLLLFLNIDGQKPILHTHLR